MTKKLIYLLRHGAVELPHDQAMVGQIDLPLSGKGIRQAEQWRDVFVKHSLDCIYCSDLQRSLQTAEIIATGRKNVITVLPELREIDLGVWEGLSRQEIQERFPAEWDDRQKDVTGHRPPGGESFVDLKERIGPVFEGIVASLIESALVVGHAGVNRVILSTIFGMPLSNIFRLKVDYGSLSTINVAKDQKMITALNLTPPVEEELHKRVKRANKCSEYD